MKSKGGNQMPGNFVGMYCLIGVAAIIIIGVIIIQRHFKNSDKEHFDDMSK
jgi:hypothetical protein